MAIPKTLKAIDQKKALGIIRLHPEGYWDGAPFHSDFIYNGRKTKYGYHRQEMIRAYDICGREKFEHGVVCN